MDKNWENGTYGLDIKILDVKDDILNYVVDI
jgi:hypothetical protein